MVRKGLKKELVACLIAGGMLTLPGNVFAQSDGSNVYDFRKNKGTSSAFKPLDNNQIEDRSDKLMAAEAELMKKLNTNAPQQAAQETAVQKSNTSAAANDLESALAREKAILEKLEAATNSEAPAKIANQKKISTPKVMKASSKTKSSSRAMAKSSSSTSKKTAPTTVNASLKKLKASKAKISTKISRADSRIQELLRQLEDTQNRLMIAETEVERLSKVIEARNIQNLSKFKMKRAAQGGNRHVLKPVKVVEKYGDKDITEDMNIATIVVAKANLRTGPGLNNSPLMTVSKGTRLAVETRRGEWYRVIAPSGTRAWVSADVVRFGKDNRSEPSRTVNVKGYNGDLEDSAIQLIRNRS